MTCCSPSRLYRGGDFAVGGNAVPVRPSGLPVHARYPGTYLVILLRCCHPEPVCPPGGQAERGICFSCNDLKFEGTQVLAKRLAKFPIFQPDFYGSLQKSQFVSRVVGFSLVDMRQQARFLRQQTQRVRELDFAAASRLG